MFCQTLLDIEDLVFNLALSKKKTNEFTVNKVKFIAVVVQESRVAMTITYKGSSRRTCPLLLETNSTANCYKYR
jgi:hypothetical protein